MDGGADVSQSLWWAARRPGVGQGQGRDAGAGAAAGVQGAGPVQGECEGGCGFCIR
uniref:Uncharacterized protein n=1 Tax=Acidipropionibacterium jensenii TaxID=1749 RepID=I3VZA7_9ACTN|nr:hypothetical protein [Acidipropionibacterium jensenii]